MISPRIEQRTCQGNPLPLKRTCAQGSAETGGRDAVPAELLELVDVRQSRRVFLVCDRFVCKGRETLHMEDL